MQRLSDLIANDASVWDIRQKISQHPESVNEGWITTHDDTTAMTPLHHAVRKGRWDLIKLLVDHGADLNASSRDTSDMTPLHLALAESFAGIVGCRNKHRPKKPSVPARILPLLKSERNINVEDVYGQTPLSYLMYIRYRIHVPKEAFDQRTVDSGQDVVIAMFKDDRYVLRCTPLPILKHFATRENVRKPHETSRFDFQLKRNDGIWTHVRWDVVMLYMTLGADHEAIRGKEWELLAKTAPSFLHEFLTTTDRRVAQWQYMPCVYMSLTKQPLSLHLCAALAAKKEVASCGSLNKERRQLKKRGLPPFLVEYVVDVEEELHKECNGNMPQVMEDELNSLSW